VLDACFVSCSFDRQTSDNRNCNIWFQSSCTGVRGHDYKLCKYRGITISVTFYKSEVHVHTIHGLKVWNRWNRNIGADPHSPVAWRHCLYLLPCVGCMMLCFLFFWLVIAHSLHLRKQISDIMTKLSCHRPMKYQMHTEHTTWTLMFCMCAASVLTAAISQVIAELWRSGRVSVHVRTQQSQAFWLGTPTERSYSAVEY